ncbi:MAG: isoprenoid biosynthesis glyoxalase ElbB [Deltaproteobacteria bacterium]|nr:isoprenoid biosynthesis glyoxalase ElbB [Deltaproteobacteria bacterium]
MKKVGVVLAGSGVMDGSEIHEATLTLYFLDRAGAEIVCMAPDVEQRDVVNHLKGEPSNETRNVLVEAARIARGNIKDIKEIKASDLDALIFPGGYGAAKNLCDFAIKGADCTVNPEVERLIKEMHEAGKPMGFICIAPVIAAKVLGAEVTIGNDKDTAAAIEKMGGKHVVRNVDDIAVDEKNNVVSTPAYMLGPTISKVALGIEKLVNKVLELS